MRRSSRGPPLIGSSISGGSPLLHGPTGRGETPRAEWMDREIPMINRGDGFWCGFLGVDLKSPCKVHVLRIWTIPSGREKRVDIRIKSRDYGSGG